MRTVNFDEVIERRGTGCVKWDEAPSGFPEGGESIIPMWVADMDFPVAPAIQEAVRRRASHPVFGYTHVGDDYYEAIASWFARRHGWKGIRREHIIYTTGVVPAVSACLKAMTLPGEKVLVLSPVYNCFFSSIRNSGCEVVEATFRRVECRTESVESVTAIPSADGTAAANSTLCTLHSTLFEVDWEDFEAKCADEKTTVFLLCNPHNPVGRVWTKEELARMGDICRRHGVSIISDEIHCELTMPGHRFQPFAPVFYRNEQDGLHENGGCVVLNSPSKAFNIAGLQIANIICADPQLRRRIDRAININEVCDVNPFGPVALVAAYNESEAWLDALNGYLWENYQALVCFVREHLPQWHVCPLEGTYLVWVDITATGLTSQQFADRLLRDARVRVNPGTMYGTTFGEGFIRINIACPRSLLMEALRRIAL
jgi:cystathionine beta-lyase